MQVRPLGIEGGGGKSYCGSPLSLLLVVQSALPATIPALDVRPEIGDVENFFLSLALGCVGPRREVYARRGRTPPAVLVQAEMESWRSPFASIA